MEHKIRLVLFALFLVCATALARAAEVPLVKCDKTPFTDVKSLRVVWKDGAVVTLATNEKGQERASYKWDIGPLEQERGNQWFDRDFMLPDDPLSQDPEGTPSASKFLGVLIKRFLTPHVIHQGGVEKIGFTFSRSKMPWSRNVEDGRFPYDFTYSGFERPEVPAPTCQILK